MVSGPPFALTTFGTSLTAFHASASPTGTGLTAGIISGKGAISGLVAKTSGVVGRGTGEGIAMTPSSAIAFSVLGVKGVDVGWDG